MQFYWHKGQPFPSHHQAHHQDHIRERFKDYSQLPLGENCVFRKSIWSASIFLLAR